MCTMSLKNEEEDEEEEEEEVEEKVVKKKKARWVDRGLERKWALSTETFDFGEVGRCTEIFF